MPIFNRPRTYADLCETIDNAFTESAMDEVREYATDIARASGYPDPVEQAECWLEDAPFNKRADRSLGITMDLDVHAGERAVS